MRNFIVTSLFISIIGHSIFFSIFKTDIRSKLSYSNPQLYLITSEQFDYLNSIIIKSRDIIMSPLFKSLSNKNPIWNDTLGIIKDIDIMGLDVEIKEDTQLLDDSKGYNFQEIHIPLSYYEPVKEELIPIFSNLFSPGILAGKVKIESEQVLKLSNGRKIIYYIQGPIVSRRLTQSMCEETGLTSGNTQKISFNIINYNVKAMFRFWVTKDGTVNQVIIEKSSSFPLLDIGLIDLIKTLRFSPVSDLSTPSYEWGVVCVGLQ